MVPITDGSGGSQVIKLGHNLTKISKQFYGDVHDFMKIAQANGISNPDLIRVGQELKIPASQLTSAKNRKMAELLG